MLCDLIAEKHGTGLRFHRSVELTHKMEVIPCKSKCPHFTEV